MDLKINPMFRDKIPPLTADEFEQLQKNILADGIVREPLVVWNGQIVDGHHRWKIICEHPEIPYTVKEMDFADEWAAIAWMCANQLGRRNISEAQRMVLTADYYNARKQMVGNHGERDSVGMFIQMDQNGPKGKNYHGTRTIVAEELGVSQKNVLKSVEFSAGLDAAEEVSSGFKEKVLSGEIKAPKSQIAAIRKMDDDRKKDVVEKIERGEKVYPEYKPTPCATQMVASHEYNSDDLKSEIVSVFDNMDKSLKMLLVMAHNEKLKDKEWRDKAKEAVEYGKEVIEKFSNMLGMIGD